MSGWGNQGQGGQGWGNQGQGHNQGQHQGWGQGQQHSQGGWGQQGQQGQQQGGWGQQGQQGGWGQQGQQHQQGGWVQQGQNQGFGQQNQGGWGQGQGQQGWGQPGQVDSLFDQNRNYAISSVLQNDKVLDVSQGNNETKNKLILWNRSGDNNQKFRFKSYGGGRYQILSNAGGALQVPNNSSGNGEQLQAGQASGSPSQFFTIYPSKAVKDAFCIKTFTGKNLDLCEGSTHKGTKIIQWDQNNDKNQAWYITPC